MEPVKLIHHLSKRHHLPHQPIQIGFEACISARIHESFSAAIQPVEVVWDCFLSSSEKRKILSSRMDAEKNQISAVCSYDFKLRLPILSEVPEHPKQV